MSQHWNWRNVWEGLFLKQVWMSECLFNSNTLLWITIGSRISDEEQKLVQNHGFSLRGGEKQGEDMKMLFISTHICAYIY